MNEVSEDLKKSQTFWLANIVVEAEAGQDNSYCMPPKLENAIPL